MMESDFDMKVEAIVLAGGSGTRLDPNKKKQYIQIDEKDILQHTLEKFQCVSHVNNVIVVCSENDREHIEAYKCSNVTKFANSGAERMFSVNNALELLDEDTDVVIVHDGVRMFFDDEKIQSLVEKAYEHGGAIYAVKSTDTIKKVENMQVCETVDRSNLYNVQTPQAFEVKLLKQCYSKIIKDGTICTDDSMVVELTSDKKIQIVESDYDNIKITTKIDLEIAKAIIRSKYEKS